MTFIVGRTLQLSVLYLATTLSRLAWGSGLIKETEELLVLAQWSVCFAVGNYSREIKQASQMSNIDTRLTPSKANDSSALHCQKKAVWNGEVQNGFK